MCAYIFIGFPGGSSKEPACPCRRLKKPDFYLWGWEYPLEEDMATHPSILTWKIILILQFIFSKNIYLVCFSPL